MCGFVDWRQGACTLQKCGHGTEIKKIKINLIVFPSVCWKLAEIDVNKRVDLFLFRRLGARNCRQYKSVSY